MFSFGGYQLELSSSSPQNLLDMSLRFQIRLRVIELLTITLLGASIVVYVVAALCMPDTETSGLLRVAVSLIVWAALTLTVQCHTRISACIS